MNVDEAGRKLGVGFNLSEEPRLWQLLAEAGYDIDQAANYADAVCRRFFNDPSFLEGQFGDELSLARLREMKSRFNFTSLGNAAYLALNAPPPYGEMSRKMYWRLADVMSDGAVAAADHDAA